jgi:L-ascorbate metabolism protein UlaG (beta-lactamase superfamily)
MPSSIAATLIGGPTLALNYAGLNILLDPTFDEPGDYPAGPITLRKLVGPAIASDDLAPVDLVLLSHDQHPDNLDRAGRELLAEVATVVSTTDAAERIDGVVGLEPWQTTEVGDITVTAVPAEHGPEGAEAISGKVVGFVLQASGWPDTYLTGDNASLTLVRDIAARFDDIELVVVFVGAANVGRFGPANVTFDAADVLAVAELLPAATLVPVHFADWAHFTEPISATADLFAANGIEDRLIVPKRGHAVEVWAAG